MLWLHHRNVPKSRRKLCCQQTPKVMYRVKCVFCCCLVTVVFQLSRARIIVNMLPSVLSEPVHTSHSVWFAIKGHNISVISFLKFVVLLQMESYSELQQLHPSASTELNVQPNAQLCWWTSIEVMWNNKDTGPHSQTRCGWKFIGFNFSFKNMLIALLYSFSYFIHLLFIHLK